MSKELDPELYMEEEEKPEKKLTVDELLVKMERMKQAQEGIPRHLILKQTIALLYIIINIVFLYANASNSYAGYIAIYMVPQLILFMDYFLVVGQLKKLARGEIKNE